MWLPGNLCGIKEVGNLGVRKLLNYLFTLVLMFAYSCECPAQEVQPTPADQSDLAEWWDWCMAHEKVIYRESKRFGNALATRPCTQRLKVPGPPSLTPFGSMKRVRSYTRFINSAGNEVRLNQGWSYQTETSPGIGNGPPERIEWGAE